MTKQIIHVIVNGQEYAVEVADVTASPLEMTVNGKHFTVEVEGAQPVVTPRTEAPTVAAPQVETTRTETPRAVPPRSTPAAPAPAGGAGAVLAPMPGVILDIAVRPGDVVEKGDTLCSLEAMKMKSAIRAPHGGTIASVEVSEGAKVNHNDVLVRFA
ncbi:MAG: acetyl-CoA carboxylase biotin carboxyl carrier protein subunit [Anaerolineae bacterium]|jgi:biotin carboxyl carrier protein|nr:acetyl-CoA carboxylase biotin carboxyl carrier protein subunit [Anaerolineae bacterium]